MSSKKDKSYICNSSVPRFKPSFYGLKGQEPGWLSRQIYGDVRCGNKEHKNQRNPKA